MGGGSKIIRKTNRNVQIVIIASALFLSAGMLISAIAVRQRRDQQSRPMYTVSFNDIDGNELVARKVYEGDFAVPPDDLPLSANQAFLDWGNPLYPVRSDAICSPSIEDVTDGTNVFFVNTQYIQTRKAKNLQLQIGGQVALDELEIELQFNPNSLEFRSASSSQGRVQSVEKGVVRFTLNANEMLSAPCVLADIELKAIGDAFTFSEFTFNVNTAQIDSTPATFERMKTRVFIYKPYRITRRQKV